MGWDFNTRTLTFSLPRDKRTVLVEMLAEWQTKSTYTLLEAAELHGKLGDASRANRKGRAQFFAFQNSIRRALHLKFTQVRGFYKRRGKERFLQTQLPRHLHSRINSLLAKDMASLLWATASKIAMTDPVRHELAQVHRHLSDFSKPWEMQVGHVIPRDATFTSIGDACNTGGGAFCDELTFWFDVLWSEKTKAAIQTKKIHINVMEFVVVLLQLAAIITLAEEPELFMPIRRQFPAGIPALAKLLIRTDNSPSQNWAHKVSAKSEKGQLLVSVFADMLERTTYAVHCNHIAGISNTIADFISRPPSHNVTVPIRHQQIFRMAPKLATYRFFRPSPDLISLLESRLFSEHWLASPPLPKKLGQFEIAGSITYCSVLL